MDEFSESDELLEDNPTCPFCGGQGILLGQLGILLWFACRNCGFQFSIRIQEKE